MRTLDNWQPATAAIPDSPGVYLFRDASGRVIYVGKAKSLKHRIPAYFGAGLHPRTCSMTAVARQVEWIVTRNEVEALQLEVTLIKHHQTRFNVKYRDDKSYPYLTVSFSEAFPRAKVTRGKTNKLDRYYGPYAHAYAIRETLDLLLRVFPLRSCSKGVFDRAARTNRPCLLHHIGRCSAPCVGNVSPGEHMAIVGEFCAFMDGNHERVVTELQARMDKASGAMEYESAARFRDQLSAVKRVIERQEMVSARKEDFDIIGFYGDELEAAVQAFYVRGGRVVGRKGFIVDKVEDLDDAELVHSFIESNYADEQQVPRLILVSCRPTSAEVLQQWLSERRSARVSIAVPQRGSKRRLMETVQSNAREAFERHRLKRSSDFASRARALNELKEHLGLPEAPLRIECFDISNLGTTDIVGSMVVFEDALPKKSDYRRFKVNGVEGQDDFASIAEVVERRFSRLLKEQQLPVEKGVKFAYRPGLVVVDGGKGQLGRAVQAMTRLGVGDIPVISLAKRLEEVYLPGRSDPVLLPRGSEALYLLQRLRDEAHRFAVTYQRTRRAQRMTRSALDTLSGVGPARRKALLRHFGSAGSVGRATPEEIAEVPGIGPALARKIHQELRPA